MKYLILGFTFFFLNISFSQDKKVALSSSGATTGIEVIELIDSKSMTAAMETANKVVSAYQAPNK